METLKEFISKEASLADWLSGLGTFSVVVIALWPSLRDNIFYKFLFPSTDINISGNGNIVCSSDGRIYKIQIPLQFENKGFTKVYVEQASVDLVLPDKTKHNLIWRLFIQDFFGQGTSSISNPYRFSINPKEEENKFIEFISDESINVILGEYKAVLSFTLSYGEKKKSRIITLGLKIDQNLKNQVEKNARLALEQKKPHLVGIKLESVAIFQK